MIISMSDDEETMTISVPNVFLKPGKRSGKDGTGPTETYFAQIANPVMMKHPDGVVRPTIVQLIVRSPSMYKKGE